MTQTRPANPATKLHRVAVEYAPLSAQGPAVTLPAWNGAVNRQQIGRLAVGGCVYGGQTLTFWGPLRDLLHITDGPVGCGVYAHARRPQDGRPMGIADFAGLNLGTDIQERDIVFGTLPKLERAMTEADRLFPLHRGTSLLATCPIALIGDDLGAAARCGTRATRRPAVAVPCAGFLRGDGVGATHGVILDTWRDWARTGGGARRGAYQVTLLCPELDGAWRGIVRLLERLGLEVVARWPGGADRATIGRLGHGRLTVSVGLDDWAQRLERIFGQPWVAADFLGPSATAASLRRIAARFDHRIQRRAESVIAAESPAAEALVASYRARLAGRLYLSLMPLDASEVRPFTDFGLRVGSAQQGWPDPDGVWQMPEECQRYSQMTPERVGALLRRARPALVGGLGQDAAALRKAGYAILDDQARGELARAASGFDGTARLGRTLLALLDDPARRLRQPPWQMRPGTNGSGG